MRRFELLMLVAGLTMVILSEKVEIQAAACDKQCRMRDKFYLPATAGANKYREYDEQVCWWCTRANSLCDTTIEGTDNPCLVEAGRGLYDNTPGPTKYWKATGNTMCNHNPTDIVESTIMMRVGEPINDNYTKCTPPSEG